MMLFLILVTGFPLSSVWVPFGFPRKKWVPFINMHNGRVNDISYCYNLGFLHTNERHSSIIATIRLPVLARSLITLIGS